MAVLQGESRPEVRGRQLRKWNSVQQARQLHLYLGTFFAPAVLFFAITGGLQTFSLHERTRGSSYTPPPILVKLAQLHKKQTLTLPERKGPPPGANAAPTRSEPRPGAAKSGEPAQPAITLLLKWFTVLMSIGLVVTTLLGIYMAFKYNRDRRLLWGLLITGTLLPALLALA